MQYVYVLICKDDKFYAGCTDNLKARVERHQKGYALATKERRPVELKAYFAFKDKHTAFRFEKYLKTGSGRAFLNKRLM